MEPPYLLAADPTVLYDDAPALFGAAHGVSLVRPGVWGRDVTPPSAAASYRVVHAYPESTWHLLLQQLRREGVACSANTFFAHECTAAGISSAVAVPFRTACALLAVARGAASAVSDAVWDATPDAPRAVWKAILAHTMLELMLELTPPPNTPESPLFSQLFTLMEFGMRATRTVPPVMEAMRDAVQAVRLSEPARTHRARSSRGGSTLTPTSTTVVETMAPPPTTPPTAPPTTPPTAQTMAPPPSPIAETMAPPQVRLSPLLPTPSRPPTPLALPPLLPTPSTAQPTRTATSLAAQFWAPFSAPAPFITALPFTTVPVSLTTPAPAPVGGMVEPPFAHLMLPSGAAGVLSASGMLSTAGGRSPSGGWLVP